MLTSVTKRKFPGKQIVCGLALALFSAAACAHHVMDGAMPATFVAGLLSGLGHPIIGADHLLFVLALGVLCRQMNVGLRAVAAFIAASLLGIALHLGAVGIPGNESLVALSLLAAGYSLWAGAGRWRAGLIVAAALVGIFHGYAYGESIVGAQSAALSSYLLGLVLVQSLIGAAAYYAATAAMRSYAIAPKLSQWFGALVSLSGAGFLLFSVA